MGLHQNILNHLEMYKSYLGFVKKKTLNINLGSKTEGRKRVIYKLLRNEVNKGLKISTNIANQKVGKLSSIFSKIFKAYITHSYNKYSLQGHV